MKSLIQAVLIFCVWLSGTDVNACTCSAPGTRHAFRESAFVFIGQVLETGLNPDEKLCRLGYISKITFKIEKRWKGSFESEVTLLSDYWVGTCPGFNFEVRKKYLVYAYREHNQLLTHTECAPSLPLAKASEEIERLNRFWFRFFARANPF